MVVSALGVRVLLELLLLAESALVQRAPSGLWFNRQAECAGVICTALSASPDL
jgi:hypothetical protein